VIRRVVLLAFLLVPFAIVTAPVSGAAQACGARADFKANMPPRVSQGQFTGADFSCQDLSGIDFTQATLDGINGEGANFSSADLGQVSLKGAILRGAEFNGASMTQTSLQGADLRGAHLAGAKVAQLFVDGGTKLAGAALTGIPLDEVREADRTGTPYADASTLAVPECAVGSKHDYSDTVKGISFPTRDLKGIDLSCQDLSGLSFVQGNLQGTNFNRAKIAGVDFSQADLTGASLLGVEANGADFGQATLSRAQLADGNFTGAEFIQSDLRKVDAPRARFDRASFIQAQIDEGDFTGASFRNANLGVSSSKQAILRDTDLTGATDYGLSGADLAGAKGRSDPAAIAGRVLLAIGIGIIVIGIVFAIVRRSRGIARDTAFSSFDGPPSGPPPPGPPPPGPGASS
jgi:uncharacterized protein YjbI with pentapeptide repeats